MELSDSYAQTASCSYGGVGGLRVPAGSIGGVREDVSAALGDDVRLRRDVRAHLLAEPTKQTNRKRGGRIYPQQAPIAKGEGEYTHSRHQSQKGRGNTPARQRPNQRNKQTNRWNDTRTRARHGNRRGSRGGLEGV
eukprot:1193181-Prorocentrum_minimum.AAC.3